MMRIRIFLAFGLLAFGVLLLGCGPCSGTGGGGANSPTGRVFASLPPGCELMVIRECEMRQQDGKARSLLTGDIVRLVAAADNRLQVLRQDKLGTIKAANVIPVADAHDWLFSKLSEDPDNVCVRYGVGKWYRRCDLLGRAVEEYDKALKIEPKNAIVLNAQGNVLRSLGKLTPAIARYSEALDNDPDYLLALTNRAYAYHQIGNYDKAVADCQAALEIDGKCGRAWRALGLVRSAQGEHDKSFTCYTKAIECSARPAGYVYSNRAYLQADRYEHRAACEDAATAMALDDTFLKVKSRLVTSAKAALEQDEDCAAAHLVLGARFTDEREWEQATQHLNLAIEKGVDTHVPYLFLARQDLWHQRVKDAAEHIALAEKTGQHSARVHLLRADCARMQDDFDAAIAAYGKAILLDPFNSSLYTSRAELLAKQGDMHAAHADHELAVAIVPYRSHLRRQLGTSLLREGKAKESVDHLWTAVDINPNDPAAHLELARGWQALLGGGSTPAEESTAGISDEQAARDRIINELEAMQLEPKYRKLLESRREFLDRPLALIRRFTTVPPDIWTAPAADIEAWYRQQARAAVRQVPQDYDLQVEFRNAEFFMEQFRQQDNLRQARLWTDLRQRLPTQTWKVANEHGLIEQLARFPIDVARVDDGTAGEKGDQADAILSALFEATPEEFGLQMARGKLRLARGQADEALVDFKRACETKPESAYALTYQAMALVDQGEIGGAIEVLKTCRGLAPDRRTPVHWRTRADADWRTRELLKQSISQNSRSTLVFAIWLEDGGPYYERLDRDARRRLFDDALESNPELRQAMAERRAALEMVDRSWRIATRYRINDVDLLLLVLEQWVNRRDAGLEELK